MMAKSLDENGAAKVYIIGRRLEKLQEVASQATNKSIIAVQGDIASKESLENCARIIASETPFVNVVIANGGAQGPTVYGLPQDRTPTLSEMHHFLSKPSYDDFNEAFDVNSTGTFYTFVSFMLLLDAGNIHEASPTVASGVKSQFIITGSIGGMSRRPGMGFAYAASKAASIHMMKQLSTTMVPYQIRANIINAGIFPSDMSNVGFLSPPSPSEKS